MIFGAHVMLYSGDAGADRNFLRDVLGFKSVDAGHGWLIFKLPAAEAAVHPVDGGGAKGGGQAIVNGELYLMCEDIEAEIKALTAKDVVCGRVDRERWGIKTTIPLPSGGAIGLYQPTHALALEL